MKFDLEKSGEWFTFFESEITQNGETKYHPPIADAGRVCFRISDTEAIEQIYAKTRKKTSEFVLNPKTRQMEKVKSYDQTPEQERVEREMIWDYAIVAWENILDANGKDIPCTLENKMKLMNIPQFARFAGRCLQIVTGATEAEAEAEGKN